MDTAKCTFFFFFSFEPINENDDNYNYILRSILNKKFEEGFEPLNPISWADYFLTINALVRWQCFTPYLSCKLSLRKRVIWWDMSIVEEYPANWELCWDWTVKDLSKSMSFLICVNVRREWEFNMFHLFEVVVIHFYGCAGITSIQHCYSLQNVIYL